MAAVLTAGIAGIHARAASAAWRTVRPPSWCEGPEQLQEDDVAAELERVGIRAPSPGCTGEEVMVTEEGTALTLTMTDDYGRVTRRTVTDVGAACALIESMTGGDLLAPLLPQGDGSGGRDEAAEPAERSVSPTRPAAVVSDGPAVAPVAGRGVSLFVATELAVGSDDSGWAGLSVSGCVMLGPTCLGTVVRFWHDLDASDESANVIQKRDAGEVAISLDLPFTRRRIDFRPGVELGVGWVTCMGGFGAHPDAVDDSRVRSWRRHRGVARRGVIPAVAALGRRGESRRQPLPVRTSGAVRRRRPEPPR